MAYADGASSLIAYRSLHLLIGNALIGLVEGVLINVLFRVRFRHAVPAMILANYASAYIAAALLRANDEYITKTLLGNMPLYSFPGVLRLLMLVTFVESFLVEWPFCLWVMKPWRKNILKSAAACLIAQIASYAVIVLLYRGVLDLSLYQQMAVDPDLVPHATEPAVVYFVSNQGNKVCRINLNGTGLTEIATLDSPDYWAPLFFRRAEDKQRWDLYARQRGRDGKSADAAILKNLPVHTAGWRFGDDGEEEKEASEGWEYVCDLRTTGESAWKLVLAKFTLWVRNETADADLSIGLETPLIAWYPRLPTILPGDQVVCQFGDQILLLDLNRRRVGLLAMGHSPVVALNQRSQATQP